MLQIDYSTTDEFEDSSRELPTSEFEEGTKNNTNTPKGNNYFKDNPFNGLTKKKEQGSYTIDARIATKESNTQKEKYESKTNRPIINSWTNCIKDKPKRTSKNMSLNSSGLINRTKWDNENNFDSPKVASSLISQYKNHAKAIRK